MEGLDRQTEKIKYPLSVVILCHANLLVCSLTNYGRRFGATLNPADYTLEQHILHLNNTTSLCFAIILPDEDIKKKS